MQKQWKNNEKVWLEDFDPGSRTSTRTSRFSANARARVSGKTGPRTSTHPPGVLQRGNTTGKQKGNTTGKKWKNEKWKKNHIYNF